MDFDSAIKAHSEWKVKLLQYLANPDKTLKTGTVALDNQCPLGQWIYGEGKKYENLPEYVTLKIEHAAFHMAAGEVIRKIDSRENLKEEQLIGSASNYAKTSAKVVTAIVGMKRKTDSKQAA